MSARCLLSVSAGALSWMIAGSAWATTGTALFPPEGEQTNVCLFDNSTASPQGSLEVMVGPIPAANSYALGGSGGGTLSPLSSYPVYLIFVGPAWATNGYATYFNMSDAAVQVLSSSYLSGLVQYGGSGQAHYAGSWIDTGTDPLTWTTKGRQWYEASRAINANPSWAPSSGSTNASNSPIYVEINYACGVTGSSTCGCGNCPGGSNQFNGRDSRGVDTCDNGNCGNTWMTTPVNVADLTFEYPDAPGDVGDFTWMLSHELAERMSVGTGHDSLGCAGSGGQIGDGEPENRGYNLVMGSSNLPVQAYWSVVDQAYIVPGAAVPNSDTDVDARVLLTGGASFGAVSLRKGRLSGFGSLGDGSVPTGSTLDTQVMQDAVDAFGNVYELTTSGVVRELTHASLQSPLWTALTDAANTHVSEIVAPHTGCAVPHKGSPSTDSEVYGNVGAGLQWPLFMLASQNNANPQVWQWSGIGANWTALSPTFTFILTPISGVATSLAAVTTADCSQGGAASTTLYMLAYDQNNVQHVWQYSGSGQAWNTITGSNTIVTQIASVNNTLYMTATNNPNANLQVWQWSGSNWFTITPPYNNVVWMSAAGNTLVAEVTSFLGFTQMYQYVPYGDSAGGWTLLNGTNTTLAKYSLPVVQDGIELFEAASNGGGNQMWEFQGIAPLVNSTWGWLPLTQTSSYVVSGLTISFPSDILQMYANQGGNNGWYNYGGAPNNWSLAQ